MTTKARRYIVNKLRLAWRYYSEERKECILRFKNVCEKCSKPLKLENINVDHKEPVVNPKEGFKDWNEYVDKLFCISTNLWNICNKCHKLKTAEENLIRKEYKTGRYSKQALQSLSKSLKGHTFLKGIPKTEAHKKAMSLERKGKPQTVARIEAYKKMIEKNKIPIVAVKISTNERYTFNSLNHCAISLGLVPSDISRVLRKEQNRTQHKGWVFEYVNSK